jgi:hypothetical protein
VLRNPLTLALLFLATVFAGCVSASSKLETSIAVTHPALHRSDHFELRYRPGTVLEPELVRMAALLEQKLARFSALLELEVKTADRYTVFVFRDVAEMQADTGRSKEVGGFAWGKACYVALNNDPALFHELVHMIAGAKISYLAGNLAAEGLADMLPEFSGRIDEDAIVKYYRELGVLPPLSQLNAASRLADVHIPDRQLNTYAIAASWMRFLYETHGVEKLKRYYRREAPEKAFGLGLDALEAAWLTRVERYEISPVERAFLTSRDGKHEGPTFTLIEGNSFHFVVEVPGVSPQARLTWTRNEKILPNAKGLELDLLKATPADAGIYLLTIDDPEKGEGRTKIEIKVLTPSDLPPVRKLSLPLR